MARREAWGFVLGALLCAASGFGTTSSSPAHGCPEELVDFFVGQLFVATPGQLFHHDEGVARQAVLFALGSPLAEPNGERRPLGAHVSRVPKVARSTSRWALDWDDRLRAHVFGDDQHLFEELLILPDDDVRELEAYLTAAQAQRFPLDAGALAARTHELIASYVPAALHRATVVQLVTATNDAVLRAMAMLRLRILALRSEAGDTVDGSVLPLALPILRTARWEEWHRFGPELRRLLVDVGWLAETERDDGAPAQLALWMISPEAESFRSYLATSGAPRPDAFGLHHLLRRVAKYVRPAGYVVLADVLDALGKAQADRGNVEHAYLYYDYGAGLFRDGEVTALEGFFTARRDALAVRHPSLPVDLKKARYDVQ